MKITDPDLIRNREKELLDVISGDLDRTGVQELLATKYHMNVDTGRLKLRGGDLVVHDNQVAYKIEYETVVILSLLFNRRGECLDAVLAPEDGVVDKTMENTETVGDAGAPVEDAVEKMVASEEYGGPDVDTGGDGASSGMAATIAEMIAEINKI